LRLWQKLYGDRVNVVLNDKGACTPGFNGNGLGIKNCESGLIYTDALSVGPKTNTYHSTNVFTANGTWLWEYFKTDKGQRCFSRGPSKGEYIRHDLAVRDKLTELVGPPTNPCLVDNGGCGPRPGVCDDDRGLPKCSCTGMYTCDNCNINIGYGCVEGYTLQAKGGANAGKCVSRNVRSFVDTARCDRTGRNNAAIMTFQGGQLIQRNGKYTEQDFKQPGDRCLQASGNLERSGTVEGRPCDAALPSQKWECLDDGSIRQKGTQDVFLKTDMRHCNSTTDPDTCTLEELKWNAFGGDLEGCTFCQATQALCGEGAQRDQDNAARKRTDANDANDALPFIATPSGASLLALATLALPLLQGA